MTTELVSEALNTVLWGFIFIAAVYVVRNVWRAP